MAACLLIMFLAYSAQMMFRPYMNAGEYDAVLKAHAESALTSKTHAELRAQLAGVEARGKKRAAKNLLNFEGKVDRSAVLGLLTGWLFNYNTIEQLMLFAAVLVCLMGIMYQANTSSSFYPGALDGVTAVVMIVIITAILYYFTMLFSEMAILYNEENKRRQLEKGEYESHHKRILLLFMRIFLNANLPPLYPLFRSCRARLPQRARRRGQVEGPRVRGPQARRRPPC